MKIGLCLTAAVFFCLFALFPGSSSAQDVLESIQFDDRWPDAAPGTLEQTDDTLFFAVGDVLVLLDAESFAEQSRISLDAPRGIKGLAIHPAGNLVYAACGNNGLKVIDISDKTEPDVLDTLDMDPDSKALEATAVSCLGNHLYVADNTFGLRIYDVSNPDDPSYAGDYEEISRYTDEEGEEQTSSGGYINISTRRVDGGKLAFILDQYMGLRIFDIGSASSPEKLDTYDMRSSTYFGQLSEVVDVEADDRYVYVSDAAYGIAILDYLADTANPGTVSIKKEGQIKSAGSAAGLTLSADGNTLFLADGNAGLLTADISSPTSAYYDETEDPAYPEDLVRTESYAATGAYAVLEESGDVFLANAQNGLARLQVSGGLEYQEADRFSPPSDATSVFVEEEYAYVLDSGGAEEGLRIIKLEDEDTGRFSLAGVVATPGEASAVAVHESFAWIADGTEGVTCVDITDPDKAALIENQSFGYPDDARDIQIMEDEDGSVHAFIADNAGTAPGLVIAEANSQGGLTFTSSVSITGARAVALYEKQEQDGKAAKRYAVVANTAGITVVDVTDPAQPLEKSFLDTSASGGEALDVATKPPYAVVANGPAGLLLVNLTDPENPVEIDVFDAEGTAEAIFIQQSYVHTAVGERGLLVIGISDTDPAELTAIDIDPDEDRESPYYNTPGYASDIAVAGENEDGYTYIADTHGGFLSFQHSDRIGGGINEQPFEESSDDSGCFIKVLGIGD